MPVLTKLNPKSTSQGNAAGLAVPGSAGIPAGTSDRGGREPGSHSRGYLPHFDRPDLIQTITFRLYDAVPADILTSWKRETGYIRDLENSSRREVSLRSRIEKFEDAGHGQCWLLQPAIATVVQDALLHFDQESYDLICWCIMPNHVHVMVETHDGWLLENVVHSWKSYSAQRANKLLCRKGEFWFLEYHDRFIRDSVHFDNAVRYIVQNPVKAGLVRSLDEWQFWGCRAELASIEGTSSCDAQNAGRDAGAPRGGA